MSSGRLSASQLTSGTARKFGADAQLDISKGNPFPRMLWQEIVSPKTFEKEALTAGAGAHTGGWLESRWAQTTV